MRARNIKPGFFKNDTLAELDFAGRLLFIGLWGLADREGRLEDRPKKIRAELFPYDEVEVDSFLNELEQRNFIIRYETEENCYIQIVNFDKHQNPHPRETASSIPGPTECCQGNAPDLPSRAESPSLATESSFRDHHTTTTTASPQPQKEKDEFAVVVDLISQNICLVSNPVEADMIRDWLERLPPNWVSEAIKQAALGNARSIKYVDKILQAWSAKYRSSEMPWMMEQQKRQCQSPRGRPQTFIEKAEAMLRERSGSDEQTGYTARVDAS